MTLDEMLALPQPGCVPWEPDYACCEGWDVLDPALQDRATILAWDTMRVLTAGRVGTCPVIMRPCLSPPCDLCSTQWVTPVIRDGQWYNDICGRPRCSCNRMCEIVFPGDVADVIEVRIDGQVLDPLAYRIDNGNRMIRTDGECWPSCQDMSAPLSEVGTMSVEYIPGIVPDAAGLWAAGVLACEYAKACSGTKCRLPSSVTSISRQGISMTMGVGMFPDGMTGIREVDAYLISVNPNALKNPPIVWSPDLASAGHRYQTWPRQ